jgi:Ohr subfamily peroxiredoxin
MSIVYIAEAIASGDGRNGHVESVDGRVSIDLAVPKAMGGSGAGSNPEQLVAMGFASCFLSSIRTLADQRRIELHNPEIICRARLHQEGEGASVSFEITVCLPGTDVSIAESLTAEAHRHCPYSKAFQHGAGVELQTTTHHAATTDARGQGR